MTPHNEAKQEDVAEIVLMPGDPLRAKYIADNFLENAKLINTIRNMYGYTGYYKGKKLTVFASGMGMPSIGIYAYELFKFYNVNYIIRLGSCGAYSAKLDLLDTILVDSSYTEGNFAYALNNSNCKVIQSDKYLNSIIENVAKENNFNLIKGNMLCSEVFDYYIEDLISLINRLPKDANILGGEMEAFALLYLAKYFNKHASCLLTVVDSRHKKQQISPEDRQTSLINMIKIALDSTLKI